MKETPNIDTRPLREILEDYCGRGWFLFPIKRATKRPAIYNNLVDASNDIKKLMSWAKKFPECNWGISLAKSGLVAVDIDEKGLNDWQALEFHHGEPETLKAASGSGVGTHYLFKAENGLRYRGKIVEGIDVKHNGYIAIYPSIHPRTKRQYLFVNDLKPVTPPAWLKKLITKKVEEKKAEADYKIGDSFYQKIVDQLKEKTFGYQEWVRLGMALHSAFEGSDEGLALFHGITEGVNYQDGDLEKATDKWNGFKANASGIGGGTFVHLARELGCEIPNPDFEADKDLFDAPIEEPIDERDEPPQWRTNVDGVTYTVHRKFLVDELNKEYAVMSGEGEGMIIRHWTDETGVKRVKTLNQQAFRTAVAPLHYKEITDGVRGPNRIKFYAAASVWIKSDFRQTFQEIVFRPNAPAECLNLWSPIPCERKEGDVSLVLEFIENVVCSGSPSKAAYLLDWLAHLMQKPEEKCTIVPTIIGEQGTGKGLFTDGILRAILRNYYARIDKPGVIMERFNTEQSRKFLTVLDEASWRGNHELANVMKSLTGNDTMTVEEKFGGRYTIENYSRYIITSNDKEAIHIEPTNRRYFVLEISAGKRTDLKYYGALWDELRDGGMAGKFYDWLLKRDVSKFNPKQFPTHLDTLGQDTKVSSMGAVGAFWYDGLFENPQPLFNDGQYLKKEEVYQAFLEYVDTTRHYQKGISRQKFWRETRNLIPLLKDRETRHLNGDGQFHRCVRALPFEVAQDFCRRNRLALPDTFDDLELVQEHEFNSPIPEVNQ